MGAPAGMFVLDVQGDLMSEHDTDTFDASQPRVYSERVASLLAELTPTEKAELTAGVDMWHSRGVERLGIRGLKVSDGPNGARGSFFVGTTSACLPCGTALGATWDVDLVREVGELLGHETRTKGADVLLAPTVNIHRSPLAGRNFECFSEDPHLSARLAVAYINGVQSQGVGTAVKHLIANDSEFQRHTISSEVDERTLREMLLPPFEAAIIEANSASIMTAYNRLGGIYCGEHPDLMGFLDEWGFAGFVISDWWAIKSTVGTAKHGCDLEMPGPPIYLGEAVLAAIEAGDVEMGDLDAKVGRLLTVMERLGTLDRPEHSPDTSEDRPEDRTLLRRTAADAIVLLTNNGVLPLVPSALRRVAVIGPNADVAVLQGGGSAAVNPHRSVTIAEGLRTALKPLGIDVVTAPGCDGYRNAPPIDPRWLTPPRGAIHGVTDGYQIEYFANRVFEGDPVATMVGANARLTWLGDPWPDVPGGQFSARLTATLTAPTTGTYTFTLIVGGRGRVWIDGDMVLEIWDNWTPGTAFFGLGSEELRTEIDLEAGVDHDLRIDFVCIEGLSAAALLVGGLPPLGADAMADAVALATDADAVILAVGLNQDWETEGEDRSSMDLPGRQPELIAAIGAANPNTVVLVNAGSPVSMDWVDQVGAVAQIWYLGQETGDAVADMLLGVRSPSAKLPTTFPMRYEDHPAMASYPGEAGVVRYGEEIFMGYRGYELRNIAPRFAFGHGLSYTTFELGAPEVSSTVAQAGGSVTVTVAVSNTGDMDGAEVVQLYVHDPVCSVRRPAKELRAFAKVHAAPGATEIATMMLNDTAFRYWDAAAHQWVVEPGEYELLIGTSSDDIRHRVTVLLE